MHSSPNRNHTTWVKPPVVVTIAGSDSCSGAGIQADIKTFAAHGVYGASVITAITAQNSRKITAIETVSEALFEAQFRAVFDDLRIDTVKIGMLGNPRIIELLAKLLQEYQAKNIVLDPVLASTTGQQFGNEAEMVSTMQQALFPLVDLMTPNLIEAAKFLGTVEAKNIDEMALSLATLSQQCRARILLKGGHLQGTQCTDLLQLGKQVHQFSHPKQISHNTHGTGCTLASAIAANLALKHSYHDAVGLAIAYVQRCIQYSDQLNIVAENGPLNHFIAPD